MADLLLCSRVYEDGCCDHPVTGERETEVVPEDRRAPCSICGHSLRRNPIDHPELEIACVNHLDDDEWVPEWVSPNDGFGAP